MSLAKNPRPQQRCTTDFALSGKGGGQMSEKAVFVRASNMDYIIFCYPDFPSDWHSTLVCSTFPTASGIAWTTGKADKVALGA
jgi:hypothetical protein